jgi:biopolymer transport protein ExbD
MEPVISLINIVFLILIFFMVTGTLSQKTDGGVRFIQTSGLDCCAEPDAMTISKSGSLTYHGNAISSPADYLGTLDGKDSKVKLMPDRALPAHELLAIVKQFQAAGASHIVVLTENTAK